MCFPPDSKAIGVLTSSVGGVACLRFGAGMLVLLQGAAVLLEGVAVRVVCVF